MLVLLWIERLNHGCDVTHHLQFLDRLWMLFAQGHRVWAGVAWWAPPPAIPRVQYYYYSCYWCNMQIVRLIVLHLACLLPPRGSPHRTSPPAGGRLGQQCTACPPPMASGSKAVTSWHWLCLWYRGAPGWSLCLVGAPT